MECLGWNGKPLRWVKIMNFNAVLIICGLFLGGFIFGLLVIGPLTNEKVTNFYTEILDDCEDNTLYVDTAKHTYLCVSDADEVMFTGEYPFSRVPRM